MPMLAPFVPLITAAAAAASTGLAIDQAVNSGGGTPTGPTASEQQAQDAAKKLAQQKAAWLNAQNPNQSSSSSGTPTGLAPAATSDIQAMLKVLNPAGQATGANISGGIGAVTPTPQPTNGLTNLAV